MFSNTVKWVLGLGLVFTLILATNLIDRTHFRWMSASVTTIYEDRLVAKGLVYDMRSILSDKQVALAGQDESYFIAEHPDDSAEMSELIESFSNTRLTATEEREFGSLKRHYAALDELEHELSESAAPYADPEVRARLRDAHQEVVADLFDLSRIQLEEGKREQRAASKTMGAIDAVTQIEIALLVGIAILVVLLLVFGPRTDDV